MTPNDEWFDFIVVGSGAGGGPLAANLATRGFRVLLLEAGGRSENDLYRVPGFHGLASEDVEQRWDYWVHHYADVTRERRDSKYSAADDGVLYPRAGTLGGCTAHNAMITMPPHDSDWNAIADLTGDRSWLAANMQRYFERLECCGYVGDPAKPPRNLLERISRTFQWITRWGGPPGNPSGHGYDGWLSTSLADPKLALPDKQVLRLLRGAVWRAVARGIELPALKLLLSLVTGGVRHFDPNDLRERGSPEGLCFTPLATRNGRRNGSREHILRVAQAHPGLDVRTDCLVTKVLLDGKQPLRATGVEYSVGAHLYRADSRSGAAPASPETRRVYARHDVVLSAGAYNSPQLLMLSGIGPRRELERYDIPVAVDLPGVGENLQDRYEVGVVFEMARDLNVLGKAPFRPPAAGDGDEWISAWKNGRGIYTSNGVVVGITLRSSRRAADPDLFVFGLPGFFQGYYRDYSADLLNKRNRFTWAVLKGHTENRGGRVRLRSRDPRDPPVITFRYFEEGTDTAGADLDAVVEGVLFARGIMARAGSRVRAEIVPGPGVRTREEIRTFIQNEAWGHHASCSNRMGPRSDAYAVVDSRFRVHGVRGLRVVDASVFPRIPGFFIVTPIYMISEKATDVLSHDAGYRAT